jgi:serine/threonine protein kinase/tetratricopeptide (TPR) repeat protein
MGHGSRLASTRNEEGRRDMTPERWQEVKKVLAGALERPSGEREAYLEEACAEPALRREVVSLIAAHEQTGDTFLEPPAVQGATLKNGTRLGSYEIIELLGAGGMGEVYRAHDIKLKRQAAVKVLPPSIVNDAEALVRFRREAQVLASLNHPNVVTIYEIGQDDRTVFIAMEVVDGRALSEVLAAGPMRIDEVFDVATQVAAGLAVAHQSRIVHRDLKPKNIMIRRDGLVKILDFGLSKLTPFPQLPFDQTTAVTVPRTLLGTVDYMSPQQAAGLSVDFHSDQFSFGSLLYEMVTGKRPFERGTAAQTLAAIIEDEPEPATSLNPRAPPALDAIIRRCMKKDLELRYTSTDELARELKQQREQFSAKPKISYAIGRGRFQRWSSLLTLALVCVLAAGGIWAVAPRLRIRPPSFLATNQKELVVLPFTNVGNDPASQAFCDGLVEILSSKLSQLEQFQKTIRVVPATDVLREGIVSVKEARQIFGATLVITGSIQRSDNRVRMTINLVDPQTLRQLKSKTIDTEERDISVLQDGVVLEVAELLDVRLSSDAKQALTVGGTSVPDAYDFYAQGMGYLRRYDVPQNVDNAISLFEHALEQDNRYALAEAGLGEAYWRKYEQTKDPQWAEQAKRSSAAAIGLNNKLAQVYVTLGVVHTGTGDYDQAIETLQKALALDPLNADAYQALAKAYEKRGDMAHAESTYREAIAVRPSFWGAHAELGDFYYSQGRYADAEKEWGRVVDLTPDNPRGYSNLGAIDLTQKRYEDAAKMFEKSIAIEPTDSAYSNLGVVYFSQARYPEAARYFQQAVQMNDRDSQRWHNLASAYQWSGETEKARAAFQRTAELAEEERRVNPRDCTVLIRLADAYSMLGQRQRAREDLEQALTVAPDSVDNMFQAAVIYEQLGDRKLALQWIARAIKGGYSRDLIDRAPSLTQLRLDPRFQSLFGP